MIPTGRFLKEKNIFMQQRSEETRGRILAAARDLFARNGYDATGVAEICAAAGVSKGAFYHHFPSKHDVFMHLLETWLAGLEPEILAAAGESDNVAESLVHLAPVLHEIFASGKGHLPMFLEFWVQASRDPLIWETTIAPYHRYQELFAAIMARGIEQGALREIDPGTGSRVIMALALGLILQGLFDPRGADWETVGQQGMLLLMEGMVRRQG